VRLEAQDLGAPRRGVEGLGVPGVEHCVASNARMAGDFELYHADDCNDYESKGESRRHSSESHAWTPDGVAGRGDIIASMTRNA
jgi:hypothetical protein